MSQRFLLQPVICAQSAVDLEIWADFGRFEWFCKRKGNSMTEIRVYIFGKGFPQVTASLVTCYNAVEGSYAPKSNNKVRKLDWHSIDVRRPSIGVQPSNNVRTSNGGQPWPGYSSAWTPQGFICLSRHVRRFWSFTKIEWWERYAMHALQNRPFLQFPLHWYSKYHYLSIIITISSSSVNMSQKPIGLLLPVIW